MALHTRNIMPLELCQCWPQPCPPSPWHLPHCILKMGKMVERAWGELEDEVNPKASLKPAIKIGRADHAQIHKKLGKSMPSRSHYLSTTTCPPIRNACSGERKPRKVVSTLLVIYCRTLEREEVRGKELRKSPGRD